MPQPPKPPNAWFYTFRESGKYYSSDRGYLSEDVFKSDDKQSRIAQILKDNDGEFPGLSGTGEDFVRVVIGDYALAYEIPLLFPIGVNMNPVHRFKGKWYFWDETWTDRRGPYPTRKHANAAFKKYAFMLEQPKARYERFDRYWDYFESTRVNRRQPALAREHVLYTYLCVLGNIFTCQRWPNGQPGPKALYDLTDQLLTTHGILQ